MDWELCSQHLTSGYIPVAVALVLYFVLARILKKQHHVGHIFISVVFTFYLVGILTMTGIWYRGAFSPRIVYVPFIDMIRGPIDTILNVFLFIPLGLFLPLLYDKFDRGGKVLLAGFLISLSVEIIQMFGCGATDINDLITNTIGSCAGYGVFKVLEKCISEKWIGVFRISGKNGYAELIGYWIGTVIMMLTVQPLLFRSVFR